MCRNCSHPLAEVFDFTALALGASTVSAFSLKQAIANSRKTEQHSLQAAPQAEREQLQIYHEIIIYTVK